MQWTLIKDAEVSAVCYPYKWPIKIHPRTLIYCYLFIVSIYFHRAIWNKRSCRSCLVWHNCVSILLLSPSTVSMRVGLSPPHTRNPARESNPNQNKYHFDAAHIRLPGGGCWGCVARICRASAPTARKWCTHAPHRSVCARFAHAYETEDDVRHIAPVRAYACFL